MFCERLFVFIVSNLKRISNISALPPGKISADAHGCTDFDLILGL